MVWIHGGAYAVGAGTYTMYKPYSLIALSPDVVVVSINYRLGILGFLTTGSNQLFFSNQIKQSLSQIFSYGFDKDFQFTSMLQNISTTAQV